MKLARVMGTSVVALSFCVESALADSAQALLEKIPANANAVVLIRADQLLASPMAQQENWGDPASPGFDGRPVLAPKGTELILTAAQVLPSDLSAMWQTTAARFAKPFSISNMVQSRGGVAEDLNGAAAGWTPRSGYFVALDRNTVGVVTPTNRQLAAHWQQIFSGKTAAPATSDYLKSVADASLADFEAVMALDLTNAWSPTGIRKFLQEDVSDLPEGASDLDGVSKVIAGARGLTLRIDVTDTAKAEAIVQFATDASALAPLAKPVFAAAVEHGGLDLPDVKFWDVKVEGNTLTASGPLSPASLRMLLALIDPATPSTENDLATDTSPAAGSDASLAASKQYFRSVTSAIDRVNAALVTSTDTGFLTREANRLSAMPVTGVDPALVGFGSEVTSVFSQAASIMQLGQQRGAARVASITVPGGYGTGADRESRSRADYVNVQNQRKQAMMEERNRAAEEATRLLATLTEPRAKVKADLAAKYPGQF